MAKGDALKTIATIAEIGGDLYTKNKALDLALLQIEAGRQNTEYTQGLETKRFEFAKNQADIKNSLTELSIATENRKYLSNERRSQESNMLKLYGVGPEYKTGAASDIGKTFTDDTSSNLDKVNAQIKLENNKLDQLNIQNAILAKEVEHYETYSNRFSGVNRVVQGFELEQLIADAKKAIPEATGAGLRSAFKQEMTAGQREQLLSSRTDALTKDAKTRSATQYAAMRGYLESDDFWKLKSEDKKKGEVGYYNMKEVEAAGKQALGLTDPSTFLNTLYFNEDLYKHFAANPNTSASLKAIEDDHKKILELEREFKGIGSGSFGLNEPSVVSPIDAGGAKSTIGINTGDSDLESFKTQLNAINNLGSSLKSQFDFFTNLTKTNKIKGKDDADRKFAILSDNIKEVNPTINITEEYSRYLSNPEDYEVKKEEDIFKETETIISERESLDQALKAKEESKSNANNAFWSLYDSGDVQTRALMDNFFELKPGGFYSPERAVNENPGQKQLTNDQFKTLETKVVEAAKRMAKEDDPRLYEYPLRLGAGLIPGDPFDSRYLLNKGPQKARRLISQYKEWKDVIGERYEMSEEMKILAEKYGVKTREIGTMPQQASLKEIASHLSAIEAKDIIADYKNSDIGEGVQAIGTALAQVLRTPPPVRTTPAFPSADLALKALIQQVPLTNKDKKTALTSLQSLKNLLVEEVEGVQAMGDRNEAFARQAITTPSSPLSDKILDPATLQVVYDSSEGDIGNMVMDPTTLRTVYSSEGDMLRSSNATEEDIDLSTLRRIYNSDEDVIDRSTLRPVEGYDPAYEGLRDFKKPPASYPFLNLYEKEPSDYEWDIDPLSDVSPFATGFYDERPPSMSTDEELLYDQFLDDFPDTFQKDF